MYFVAVGTSVTNLFQFSLLFIFLESNTFGQLNKVVTISTCKVLTVLPGSQSL